ncbi:MULTISPECIES: hypothetical protein [Enterobacter cloacae complex]|uniref:hypothetical protein n=1 Tax=Enterobacter cloacae complex TaxID=354276 RepID=UPI0005F03AB0|nr:hypothetical protein [Enterobacter roggenkampii]EHF8233914.1 hypothetical protein [Enterobacter roggenkampii]EKY3954093.1 hypothetical protein [Enterobacter roggenkampii]EMC7875197.1 hypothetical protein [Enterobacter roggenkampii]KJP74264.1 hypothetical protein SR65_22340 [Enterobacter roggenkampii]KLP33806.1 hypothetical protein ABF66_18610 [Enterobacter roggenkampii]
MIKILSLRLKHCNALANSMSNASPTQLQQFKTQLSEQMGKPVGLHTMGIPAAISTLGVIVSFAIPQLWLGYGVLAALSQPAERVFVWVVLVALLFAGINGVTMFMIGKGSMRAVRIHLALAVISLVLTAAYLLVALIGNPFPGVSLTAALVSIVMLLLSGSCILSTSFYKMLLFTLHNRAWRKLSGQTRDAHTPH